MNQINGEGRDREIWLDKPMDLSKADKNSS